MGIDAAPWVSAPVRLGSLLGEREAPSSCFIIITATGRIFRCGLWLTLNMSGFFPESLPARHTEGRQRQSEYQQPVHQRRQRRQLLVIYPTL